MPQAAHTRPSSESFEDGAGGDLEDGQESVRVGKGFEGCSDKQGGDDGSLLPRAEEQGYLAR